MQDSEYINLDELLSKSNIDKSNIDKLNLEKLYQIQGIKNNKGAIIKYIGERDQRPVILINEFKFKKYHCQIVSYLLSDVDIKFANDNCCLKMLGMLIKDNNNIIAAITMNFNTFLHKVENINIEKYIQYDDNTINIPGFFSYDLKYYVDNNEKIERIECFEIFPGNNRCIYNLINLLSNEKLSFLF